MNGFRCFLCNHNSYIIVYHGDSTNRKYSVEDVKITDNNYGGVGQVIQCSNCGHIMLHPYPNPQELITLYSQLEDHEYLEEAVNRSKVFKRLIKRAKKIKPNICSILDIGAYCGLLLKEANDMNIHGIGIDPSHWAAKIAKNKFNIDVLVGTINDYPLKNQFFDLITLVDVIEHINNPVEYIQYISSHQKSGDVLLIVTPDFGSPTSKLLKKNWWHVRPAHISYFTTKSINNLLNKYGYNIYINRHYAWHFSINYWLTRLIKNSRFENTYLRAIEYYPLNKLISIPITINFFDSMEIYAVKK